MLSLGYKQARKEEKTMKDITKYQGIIPAFYACYDAEGNISPEEWKRLQNILLIKV